MFNLFPERVLGRVLAMLGLWATSARLFILGLLNRPAASHSVEQQDSPQALPRPSSLQPSPFDGTEQATWSIEFPRRCYDDKYERGAEPLGRSLQLVVIRNHLYRWHVRVVLEYRLGDAASGLQTRKKALMDFCHAIDFSSLPLLDDTVTELFISANMNNTAVRLVHSPLPLDHPFAAKSDGFWVNAREDPARIRYPSYTGTRTRQIDLSEVHPISEVGVAVFTARVKSEGEQTYVLKQVERLLYMPQDSRALEKELQVLEEVGGQGNIVRLIAAVVSKNPYRTAIDPQQATPCVLRGLLLEHHPGGTLAEALQLAKVDAPWLRWAEQLCTAVATLHEHNTSHMDIKPSNMVLDKDENLVLIDVGGAGGVTREWLSPEMQQVLDPLSTSFQARKKNDTWAVGRVLCKMAEIQKQTDGQQQLLQSAAAKAMGDPCSLPYPTSVAHTES